VRGSLTEDNEESLPNGIPRELSHVLE